jgi:hypothetical protein
MGGGLLQIVSSTNEDLFLTSKPQITFFKMVFYRYTNFSIETLEEFFDGNPNFGESVTCTLAKTGDLISHIYLKIDLPEVNIPILTNSIIHPNNKSNLINNLLIQYNNLNQLFLNYKIFIKYFFILWRQLWKEVLSIAGNYNSVLDIINQFKKSDYWIEYNKYNNNFINIFIKKINNNFNFDIVYIFDSSLKTLYQYSSYSILKNQEFKEALKIFLINYRENTLLYNNQLFEELKNIKNILEIEKIDYYRFSWLPKIGLRLIDNIDISIGGQVIDRLNSDMLNIWYELTVSPNQIKNFNNIIGNIPSLYTYNSEKKPSYSLFIPLPFWFSKYTGVSLPALALRYHDIQINLKLKELSECCLIETTENNLNDNVNINEIINILNVSLYIDYVYIEQEERKKFGMNTLEYLIDQNQYLPINNINSKNINQLLYFVNPIKELIWVSKTKLWHRYDFVKIFKFNNVINLLNNKIKLVIINKHLIKKGDNIKIYNSKYYNKIYKVINTDETSIIINEDFHLNDYGYIELLNITNTENTIDSLSINFNSTERISTRDGFYYNLLMPWKYHKNIPSPGIYLFSFAIYPEQYQPSGTCNMGLLDANQAFININNDYFEYMEQNISLLFYARSINILKISEGMANLAFSI